MTPDERANRAFDLADLIASLAAQKARHDMTAADCSREIEAARAELCGLAAATGQDEDA